MNRTLKITVLAGSALAALLGAGGVAEAKTVSGTVVHRVAHAKAFVVAERSGRLVAVHASRSPAVGRSVRVTVRTLANGRYAATHVKVGRRARRAKLRGTVTYANPRASSFVVSARGVSLLVRRGTVASTRAHAAAATDTSVPAVGTVVTVDANLDPQGGVQAQRVSEDGQDNGTIELEGIVASVDPSTSTLTVSADDDESLNGATITVHLPTGFDATRYAVGDEVELHATLNPDGSYTAVYSSHDDNAREADDTSDDQGDDGGHNGGGDRHGDQGDGEDDGGSTGVTPVTGSTPVSGTAPFVGGGHDD